MTNATTQTNATGIETREETIAKLHASAIRRVDDLLTEFGQLCKAYRTQVIGLGRFLAERKDLKARMSHELSYAKMDGRKGDESSLQACIEKLNAGSEETIKPIHPERVHFRSETDKIEEITERIDSEEFETVLYRSEPLTSYVFAKLQFNDEDGHPEKGNFIAKADAIKNNINDFTVLPSSRKSFTIFYQNLKSIDNKTSRMFEVREDLCVECVLDEYIEMDTRRLKDLDDCFRYYNLNEEFGENLTELNKIAIENSTLHTSMSVGDVIRDDEADRYFVVAPIGFEEVYTYEQKQAKAEKELEEDKGHYEADSR